MNLLDEECEEKNERVFVCVGVQQPRGEIRISHEAKHVPRPSGARLARLGGSWSMSMESRAARMPKECRSASVMHQHATAHRRQANAQIESLCRTS